MSKDFRKQTEEREPKIKQKRPKARKKLRQGKQNIPSSLRDIKEDDFEWMYDLDN